MTRLARVTNSLLQNIMLQDLRRTNRQLLTTQQQLSTQHRINAPSDDPVGAQIVLRLQSELRKNEQFGRNHQLAANFMSVTEDALSEFNTLVTNARTILLREVQDTATQQSRQLSAIEVDNILNQALAGANRDFAGRFIFGGSATGAKPFDALNSSVNFAGNGDAINVDLDPTNSLPINISGGQAFGALTTEIQGDVNLDPDITYGGLASSATGGTVATLTDASLIGKGDNAFVGLDVRFTSGANAGQTRRVTAFNNATGTLTFAGPPIVAPVAGDTYLVTGSATRLEDLNAGAGVDIGKFRVDDGLGNTLDVDLANVRNVADLIDLINADPNLNVRAGINAAGNGLLLTPTLAGVNITTTELDGGHVAEQLGILTGAGGAGVGNPVIGGDLDARLTQDTAVGLLNGGAGFDQVSGIQVTNNNVTQTITFSDAYTLRDVFNKIRDANLMLSTAQDASDPNRVNLQSTLNGARLFVGESAGGTTAADLGILMDANEVSLSQLNNGLGVSTVPGTDMEIRAHDGTIFAVDLTNAQSLQDIADLINAAPGNGGVVTASIIHDTLTNTFSLDLQDTTVGVADFEVVPLNGSFAPGQLGIEQNAMAGNTINSGSLDVVGVQSDSIFTSLIRLREGLLANDREAIQRVGDLLDAAEQRILAARSEVGSRLVRVEAVGTRLEDTNVSLSQILSGHRDIDVAETILNFQQQQTTLQAGLSAAGRLLNLSLLDFI